MTARDERKRNISDGTRSCYARLSPTTLSSVGGSHPQASPLSCAHADTDRLWPAGAAIKELVTDAHFEVSDSGRPRPSPLSSAPAHRRLTEARSRLCRWTTRTSPSSWSAWRPRATSARRPSTAEGKKDDRTAVLAACRDIIALWDDPFVKSVLKRRGIRLQDMPGLCVFRCYPTVPCSPSQLSQHLPKSAACKHDPDSVLQQGTLLRAAPPHSLGVSLLLCKALRRDGRGCLRGRALTFTTSL